MNNHTCPNCGNEMKEIEKPDFAYLLNKVDVRGSKNVGHHVERLSPRKSVGTRDVRAQTEYIPVLMIYEKDL